VTERQTLDPVTFEVLKNSFVRVVPCAALVGFQWSPVAANLGGSHLPVWWR
jgi:hypothetical protein